MPGMAAPSSAQTMPSQSATSGAQHPAEHRLRPVHLGQQNRNGDERADPDHLQHVGGGGAEKSDAADQRGVGCGHPTMIDFVTMRDEVNHLSRRALVKLAGISVAGSFAGIGSAAATTAAVSLFDGKTLDGWIQIENSATSLPSGSITDPAAFAGKLTNGTDAVSVFLRGRLQDSVKADLAAYSAANANAKAVISAMFKDLNQVISGPSIYDKARFSKVVLRPETAQLLQQNPRGQQLARLNKLLLEDAYPAELAKSSATGWIVKDGAMASTGAGRGVIYTAKDYGRFRLMFTMRHVSGNPDHQAGILIFCTRPQAGEKPLDALGGIQFQVPNGGHWDYRPGMNNNGGPEFTPVTKTRFDAHEWSRVEILADASQGNRAHGCRSAAREQGRRGAGFQGRRGRQGGADCLADAQRRFVRRV